jgi:hypothetical protein
MIKIIVEIGNFRFEFDKLDGKVIEFFDELLRWKKDYSTQDKPPIAVPKDPAPHVDVEETPVKKKRAYVHHKTLKFTAKRDRILRDNFDELGHSGIFDKSLLPGFSLAEIRQRCIELKLLDQYGNRPERRGKVNDD